jgi:diguanylate cyclase (GGDEF)-like protein
VSASQKSHPHAADPGRPTSPDAGSERELPTVSEGLDLVGELSADDETAYTWDVLTDAIEWESNAVDVLAVRSRKAIATGQAFQMMIAPEHARRRSEAMAVVPETSPGRGIPYRVQYRFEPGGGRSSVSLWIEDHGRWWPGPGGAPVRARGVIRIINERYIEEQRLLHRTDNDELTGQLNRIRLIEALRAVITRSERNERPSAFLIASVNNLSMINETFGFDVGDELIAGTAHVIRDKLRGGDTVGRYSSNKFGIILNDCGPGAMRIAADRFIKAVRDTVIQTSACQLSATLSIGGVVLPEQARNVQNALSFALQALDKAKQKRSDCFMPYEPSPQRDTVRQRNISVADEVISALDEHRMRLVLQPMMTSRTHEPALYECLLRMERPDGQIVSAGEFIVVAEQLGLSRFIDRRTLELAVGLLKRHPNLRLSLNVSGLTANNHEWLLALQSLTGGRRQITERLVIEITETAALSDLDQSVAFVDTLKELGCRVAIDDFGAGYTSFKNLRSLNVDMVKIDGVFVKNMAESMSDQAFIKTMIELARTFKLETVAEWVGDMETCDLLANAGVDYLQGFHFGQPISESELPAGV